jgi:hypothetical protein
MYPFASFAPVRVSLALLLAGSLAACANADSRTDVGAVRQAASTVGKQLALGKAHSCSLDAAISGIRCWGDNRKGQSNVPVLVSPSAVAAGGDTTCAIASGDVRCWGDNSSGQLFAPAGLYQPVQLAVGDKHVCALTGSHRVSCWGDDSAAQLKAPALSDVEAIAAGSHHTCALANGTVQCWGDNGLAQLAVPELSAPSQLVAAGDHSCVLDAGKVVCWGGNTRALLEKIPEVREPRVLATGAAHACVLDQRGVQCWGDAISGDLTPPELTQTVQLAVGGGDGFAHACARHLQGVQCWGADNVRQATYDGGPLHVLHHSEARIAASSEKVWAILMDLARYPEWNPYTIAMKSTLKIGDPMIMTVKMNALLTIEQTENIRVLEQGHKVCWGIDTDTPEFNSGERCQWLEPLSGGGTRYVTEDLIEGTANPLVSALFGNDVQVGFDAVALALKHRAEQLP